MKSTTSKIVLTIIIILILIQFIRPEKNLSDDRTNDISKQYEIPETVNMILQKSCNDCHSNKTKYPWYAEIQPFGWWLSNHVKEGKEELNFSSFTTRPLAVQNHKFEEIMEEVKEDEMPLPSYTWLGMHPEADLTSAEKEIIIDWAQNQMNKLKAQYPADSLVLKRRAPKPE